MDKLTALYKWWKKSAPRSYLLMGIAFIKATLMVLLSLAFWLVIYRIVHLIVYGVALDGERNDSVPSVLGFLHWDHWLLKSLLTRPAKAPEMGSHWLDFFLLMGSFLAAVYIAMKATTRSVQGDS